MECLVVASGGVLLTGKVKLHDTAAISFYHSSLNLRFRRFMAILSGVNWLLKRASHASLPHLSIRLEMIKASGLDVTGRLPLVIITSPLPRRTFPANRNFLLSHVGRIECPILQPLHSELFRRSLAKPDGKRRPLDNSTRLKSTKATKIVCKLSLHVIYIDSKFCRASLKGRLRRRALSASDDHQAFDRASVLNPFVVLLKIQFDA